MSSEPLFELSHTAIQTHNYVENNTRCCSDWQANSKENGLIVFSAFTVNKLMVLSAGELCIRSWLLCCTKLRETVWLLYYSKCEDGSVMCHVGRNSDLSLPLNWPRPLTVHDQLRRIVPCQLFGLSDLQLLNENKSLDYLLTYLLRPGAVPDDIFGEVLASSFVDVFVMTTGVKFGTRA